MMFKILRKAKKSLHTPSNRDLVIKNADPMLSEALRATRINLMYTLSDLGEGGKTIMITSALSAEGKTTTAINLAATFAQTEMKVLLVDADLRKPRLHTYLEVKNKEGLANYLGGFVPIENVLNRMNEFNFDYITAGDIPPNPAELLSSSKFSDFLEKVKGIYDYIIIDTPPVNAVADALSIVPAVNNVVFVCRCGTSLSTEMKKAVSALEFAHAKILGFITIDSPNKRVDYYTKYSAYYYK